MNAQIFVARLFIAVSCPFFLMWIGIWSFLFMLREAFATAWIDIRETWTFICDFWKSPYDPKWQQYRRERQARDRGE